MLGGVLHVTFLLFSSGSNLAVVLTHNFYRLLRRFSLVEEIES